MGVRQLEKSKTNEWLKLARKRLDIPEYLRLRYFDEVDLLTIRFTEGKSTYSDDDLEKGVIYNYDANDELVSIEILDLYGIFVTA